MLDLPGVVVAELVGELDLGERVLQELILALRPPGARQLVLVEDAEFHGHFPLQKVVMRSIRVGRKPAGRSWPQPGNVSIFAAGTSFATSRPHSTGSSGSSSPCSTRVGTLMPFSISTRSPDAMMERYCRAPPSGYQRRSTFFSTKVRTSASGIG